MSSTTGTSPTIIPMGDDVATVTSSSPAASSSSPSPVARSTSSDSTSTNSSTASLYLSPPPSSLSHDDNSNDNTATKIRGHMILPKDFDPSIQDVIIGRGKRARTHEGNQRLRDLIDFMIPEYTAAGNNKDEKSYIIREIVVQIRKSSPDGGFVKYDKTTKRWYEVGDFAAREKISQTFRDAMGDTYSSSNPYKRKRRSFEKKHNAILDIIKKRRQSLPSPTSVLPQKERQQLNGTASNSSPLATDKQSSMSAMVAAAAAAQHQNNTIKLPGQIGFARRSVLQYGMSPSHYPRHPGMGMVGGPSQHHHNAAMLHHPHLPYPIASGHPHFATSAAGAAGVGAGAGAGADTGAQPPRRTNSMPGTVYSPVAGMLLQQQRQRDIFTAMMRRTSAPVSTITAGTGNATVTTSRTSKAST